MNKSPWIIAAAVVMTGCAGMNKEECAYADWETIGFEDGSRGATGSAIASHRKACAKAGITPDRAAYERGREKGVESYCQPANGYRVGTAGSGYAGVCPSHLQRDFMIAYNEGRELHRLRSNVSRINSKLNYEQRSLENHHDDVLRIEKALISEGLTISDRVGLLAELKEVSREIGEIEHQILQHEREKAVAVAELREYEERGYSAAAF